MSFVRLIRYLTFCLMVVTASVATAQTPPQPQLEVLSRQGDYYWVVEIAADGSRKGGWINAQVIDRISRSEMRPIPAAQPAPTAAVMPTLDVPNDYDGLVLSLQQLRSKIASAASAVQGLPDAGVLNQRSARIDEAIVILQSLAATQSASGHRLDAPFVNQPISQIRSGQIPQPVARHPQAREGFWFNGGFGVGSAGCVGCGGRQVGASGGLSLGGTVSERVLVGGGTTGWSRSVDGVTTTIGTFDARIRFYPSAASGFFLTGGGGLGTISESDAFDSAQENGVGALFGLGWDIRVGRNVSLTPFYNGFAVGVASGTFYVDQFGLGITLH